MRLGASAGRLLAGSLLVVGPLVSVVPAAAAPPSSPGECPDSAGVTIVVDFSDLDGDVVVRCVTGPVADMTGLEALRAAGFTVVGTSRWGDAFVCRIQGRPAPDEVLSFDGDDDYRERCQDTPPPQAYWGYWYAANERSWRYSSESAATRPVVEGGFEGWAFSLDDAGAESGPAYQPNRPDPPTTTATATPTPTPTPEPPPSSRVSPRTTTPTPTPSTPPPPQTAPTATTAPSPEPGVSAGGQHERNRQDRPGARNRGRQTPGSRDGAVARDQVVVTGDVPQAEAATSAGIPAGTLAAAALLGGLGLTAGGITWWRRRSQP
ncbi:MAG: hypothetical protein H0V48_11790 [Nocardioidaceae bacterium]|nr:hypothetical protein [Nocardioidaceae bacterium]